MFGLGAIGMTLGTDKSVYRVGDQMTYSIRAGIPGSQIYWTSFKDGAATGERNASYGQTIGANGVYEETVTVPAEGRYEKIALVVAPDGTESQLQTFFQVVPAAASGNGLPPPSETGFLSGSTFGIPNVLLLGAAAFFIFKGK